MARLIYFQNAVPYHSTEYLGTGVQALQEKLFCGIRCSSSFIHSLYESKGTLLDWPANYYKKTAQYLYLMEEDGVWKNEKTRGQVKIKKKSKKQRKEKKRVRKA